MINRILIVTLFLLGISFAANSQKEERKLTVTPDLHLRTFWMNTIYPSQDLKEDYALGMSLNLGTVLTYQKSWKFHFGYRTFANVASSTIWDSDPSTGQANRYETGLFDLLNTRDRFFGKLETLSLEYSKEKFGIKVGRMGINSDWINTQDGRLSPTAVEGINLWLSPDSNWKFSLWAIGKMSIRGSSEWLSVGETVGIYPQGRTVSGMAGNYFGNTQSDWIGILEVNRKIGDDMNLRLSNTIAQNLFTTYWLAFEKNQRMTSSILTYGIQAGFQQGIGDGGNKVSELRYKEPGDKNYALSGRIGWKNSKWTTHLNFTFVDGKGRWLSPREWGKDAWYTFIPRERNEGYESLKALVGYGEYSFEKIRISVYGHLGFHWLPDIHDAAVNKYNFPSYRQLNLGVKYQPKQIKKIDFHFLMVNKMSLSDKNLTPNQIYNKVEMLHFNGILNWRWN